MGNHYANAALFNGERKRTVFLMAQQSTDTIFWIGLAAGVLAVALTLGALAAFLLQA